MVCFFRQSLPPKKCTSTAESTASSSNSINDQQTAEDYRPVSSSLIQYDQVIDDQKQKQQQQQSLLENLPSTSKNSLKRQEEFEASSPINKNYDYYSKYNNFNISNDDDQPSTNEITMIENNELKTLNEPSEELQTYSPISLHKKLTRLIDTDNNMKFNSQSVPRFDTRIVLNKNQDIYVSLQPKSERPISSLSSNSKEPYIFSRQAYRDIPYSHEYYSHNLFSSLFNYSTGKWFNGIIGCLKPFLGMLGPKDVPNGFRDDWEIPFEQIKELQWLGSGAEGAVFMGKYNNEWVAVKKVKEKLETEIRHLKKLNHPNIVAFRGVCTQSPNCYCIVMEFCPYGQLYDFLKSGQQLPPNMIFEWAQQIASGMNYLHSHKIIHRDLKSPNVLISYNDTLKISDFGTCKQWNDRSTKMSFAGTVAWMAPEVNFNSNKFINDNSFF